MMQGLLTYTIAFLFFCNINLFEYRDVIKPSFIWILMIPEGFFLSFNNVFIKFSVSRNEIEPTGLKEWIKDKFQRASRTMHRVRPINHPVIYQNLRENAVAALSPTA